jgi:hypothetical protein
MKKLLLLPLMFLLFVAQNVTAQDYHPFLKNSSWILNDMISCCRPPELKVIQEGTDEVIGAYTYKRFDDPFPQPDSNLNPVNTVYIREDVAAKKVYKIVNGVDEVLYDFSLETGDVISQYGKTFTATVDNVTLSDGSTRKRITLLSAELSCGQNVKQIWIEGVGSNKHPFYPQNNMNIVCSGGGGVTIYTKCSFQNGEHIYGNAATCPGFFETMMGVHEEEAATFNLSFSPNPFKEQLSIDSDTQLDNAKIKIYNALGQLVREENNLNGQKVSINRGNMQSGMYFIELYQQNKLVKTAKVIAE